MRALAFIFVIVNTLVIFAEAVKADGYTATMLTVASACKMADAPLVLSHENGAATQEGKLSFSCTEGSGFRVSASRAASKQGSYDLVSENEGSKIPFQLLVDGKPAGYGQKQTILGSGTGGGLNSQFEFAVTSRVDSRHLTKGGHTGVVDIEIFIE